MHKPMTGWYRKYMPYYIVRRTKPRCLVCHRFVFEVNGTSLCRANHTGTYGHFRANKEETV